MGCKQEERLIEIYNETYTDVLRYVISKCNSPDDINDLMQNIYLNYFKRIKKKGEAIDSKKYLITIARNELFKHYGFMKASRSLIPMFSKTDEEDFKSLEVAISMDNILSLELQVFA